MLKQLKRIKVRKPSFRSLNASFFRTFDLNILEIMRIITARMSSTASSKYMMLKLLRNDEEIYRERRLDGTLSVI